MLKTMFACCKVYISESRNTVALGRIEQAAKLYPRASVVNKFEDEAYNRVGYTLVSEVAPSQSPDPFPLKEAVFSMLKAAFENIDFESHCGTHPRLGVVDHVCFHPLAQASLEQAAWLAKSLAADIGSQLQVPTYLYGAAHPEGRKLDSIRRELGYFNPNSAGNQWVGSELEFLPLKPDNGPNRAPRSKGVVVVGATGWVDNYNIPIFSNDITLVRKISRRVSGRGDGLPSVQAMALSHGENTTEVACNLLDPNRVSADQVQHEVERLAQEEGLSAGKGYFTDYLQEKIIEDYMNLDKFSME